MKKKTMKKVYALLVCCALVALPGCGGQKENTLATDGVTPDQFAEYEANLAKANAGGFDEEDEK